MCDHAQLQGQLLPQHPSQHIKQYHPEHFSHTKQRANPGGLLHRNWAGVHGRLHGLQQWQEG